MTMKPEALLQRDVVELARRLGFVCAHFRPAQVRKGVWLTPVGADGAGFPDLCLCGRHAVLFVELKDRHGRLSDAQTRWLERLARAGQATFVWRPADWASGEVERVLKQLAGERRCALCGAPSGSYETCNAHAGLEALDAAGGLTGRPSGRG
jgi:hypothetical protein